eukprot:1257-Heterococcus_DN1.PRE.2
MTRDGDVNAELNSVTCEAQRQHQHAKVAQHTELVCICIPITRVRQFAMCEYLRSIGCDWDANACSKAATGGQLDMLCWLREHGCPWIVSTICIRAARHGSTGILQFVIEQGEVLDAELLMTALNCAGAQWPTVLRYGEIPDVKQWSGSTLAWARAEGCTSPSTL